MIRAFSIIFLFSFLSNSSPAQLQLQQFEKQLSSFSKTLLTDTSRSVRVEAESKIVEFLGTALQLESAFQFPFDSLYHISIQYPQDSSFRIFSWQLFLNVNDYRYGGCIQEKDGGRITFLKDHSKDILDPEFDVVDASEWYGTVYYNIHDYESPRGREYLLFGFNGYEMLENKKIVDVLSFNSSGPRFGAATFFKPKGVNADKRRLVYTYSAEASFKLNFDPSLDLIIVDHLTPGKSIDGTSVLFPDGTYSGYKLVDQKWVFEEKLFHGILDEAPREVPILDDRKGKDLFGKEKAKPAAGKTKSKKSRA